MTASDGPRRASATAVPATGRAYPLARAGAVAAALERGPRGREEARSCQALWASVLHIALEDEVRDWKLYREWMELPPTGGPLMRRPERWVGSGEFYLVCALAGLDGDAVLERWQRAGGRGFALPAQRNRA